jgi:hypothetical protein
VVFPESPGYFWANSLDLRRRQAKAPEVGSAFAHRGSQGREVAQEQSVLFQSSPNSMGWLSLLLVGQSRSVCSVRMKKDGLAATGPDAVQPP